MGCNAALVSPLSAGAGRWPGWRGRRTIRQGRFHREYIAPTLTAIRTPLGLETGVTLHVDPSLGSLTPRLAKPLSPAEVKVRGWYGEHIEPIVRWLPDRL